MTRRLLVLCQANIVRSPTAELLAAPQLGGSDWSVTSAGVQALTNFPMDRTMAAALRRRGVDASRHRARQADVEMISAADLVLTFESAHRAWVLEQLPSAMRSTLTIRRAARLLATKPKRAEPLAFLALDEAAYTAEDDFADPIGKGAHAAEEALAEIDRLLGVVLPMIGATSRTSP